MIRRRHRIKIGGRWVPVRPVTLENALSIALLLAPHLARIEDHWSEIKRALDPSADSGQVVGDRPQILTTVFTALREELAGMPGDMIKAVSLLVDIDPLELAGQITAQEFVEALPVLDEVNDLAKLWGAVKALGLTARYKENGE